MNLKRLANDRFAERVADTESILSIGAAMNMRCHELINNLKVAAGEAGPKMYQRLAWATELLTDRDWVTSPSGGGGSEDLAMSLVTDQFFPDVTGTGLATMNELLTLYRKVPEKTWKKYKYHIPRLWKMQDDERRDAAKREDDRLRKIKTDQEARRLAEQQSADVGSDGATLIAVENTAPEKPVINLAPSEPSLNGGGSPAAIAPVCPECAEMHRQIQSLSKRVRALEKENAFLRHENNDLREQIVTLDIVQEDMAAVG